MGKEYNAREFVCVCCVAPPLTAADDPREQNSMHVSRMGLLRSSCSTRFVTNLTGGLVVYRTL